MKNVLHGPATEELQAQIDSLTSVDSPNTLTPQQRRGYAQLLGKLVSEGAPIDLTAIHPQVTGPDTLAHAHQVQKGLSGF